MADAQITYNEISSKTAQNLKSIAHNVSAANLSRLSLPEVDALVDQVAQAVPAGNVPGVILNGLARLPGRQPPPQTVKRDINLLFRGVGQALDKAVYGTLFAGPAAVLQGYQNLLKLAGKDPEEAFPEGTWQFYVDYALREDTARHLNETHGFDTDLGRHNIQLNQVDRMTAWVMTAVTCLHQYPELLANEWRERVYTYTLREVTESHPEVGSYAGLYRQWSRHCPYRRGADGANETYAAYRRRKFDEFFQEATKTLPQSLRQAWQERITLAEAEALPAYQQQMSILAYLEPGLNDETHVLIPLKKGHVGLIYQGRYYLLPACGPNSEQPADVLDIRTRIATLMAYPPGIKPVSLTPLAALKRTAWPEFRKKFSPALLKELDTLRLAPILLNFDRRPRSLSLADLRQAERGVGDHALTLLDTGETLLFDQSQIFFDAPWGAALAEIMTNEALSWALYLSSLPPAQARQTRPAALAFNFGAAETELIQKAPQLLPEVSAETEAVNLKAISRLRRLFKQRNDLLQLTVNDLLILYRAIHAQTYEPSPALRQALNHLAAGRARQAALATLAASKQENPAIVIPIDGSQRQPPDRLYPITFEVPLAELDLLALHRRTLAALDGYKEGGSGDRSSHYASFDKLQRTYLATLAGFGLVLSKAKEIAVAGNPAAGSSKVLSRLPGPLQGMLEKIPGRGEILNDVIKGREILTNLGAVVPSSTLTRFLTAKDDHEKKALAWGILTDARGVMRITLRDFRPHVGLLLAAGEKAVATHLVQDYLDSYAQGLNRFILDLQRITETSRETRMIRVEKNDGG